MAVDTLEKTAVTPVTVTRHNGEGEPIDIVELDQAIFGVTPNIPLMHQVVTAQLAARRSGTHSTRTRAEVAGGGAKPYRQKGTGRARQGTIRAPQFTGGGVAMGPKPRSYAQRTPRKMIRLALNSALSDRLANARLCLVDAYPFEVPKTKDAVKFLGALGLEGSVLVVLGPDDAVTERSFANLPHIDLVEAAQLTAYEVLANDWILFSSATLPGEFTVVEGSAEALAALAAEAEADADAGDGPGGETSAGSASTSAAGSRPRRRSRAAGADTAADADADAGAASGGETSAGDDSSADDDDTVPATSDADGDGVIDSEAVETEEAAETDGEAEADADAEAEMSEAAAEEDEAEEDGGDSAAAEVSSADADITDVPDLPDEDEDEESEDND